MNTESPSRSVTQPRNSSLAGSVTSKVRASRRRTSVSSRSMCFIWASMVVKNDNPE